MAGTAAADPLPDEKSAYGLIFEELGPRVFFHKLASIRPQYYPKTEDQARTLLKIAADLDMVEEEETVKQAADGIDPLTAASLALTGVMKEAGYTYPNRQVQQEEAVAVKQAAAELAADPGIFNAILALKAGQAERARAHLGV